MKARLARRAVLCLLWGFTATAGLSEVRLERRPDGTLEMVNRGSSWRPTPIDPRLRREIDSLIDAHAGRQGLDPDLVRAVVVVESSYDPTARSSKGAMGLMQLMPATARSLRVDNPYDPDQNLRGGTTYLRRMIDRFDGDLELALAGYNAGPEAVARYGGLPPYAETRGYVGRVLSLFRGESATVGEGQRLAPEAARPARRTYLHRDATGRLVLSTTRPSGS